MSPCSVWVGRSVRHSKLVIVVGGLSASYYSGIYMYMGLSKNPLCVCVCVCVCVLLHVQLWLIFEKGFVAVIINELLQSTNINYMYIALV